MTEKWKPVTGWEGLYDVSDHGRVRSHDRVITCRSRWGQMIEKRRKGRILSLRVGKNGYPGCVLAKNASDKTVVVHRLVAEAFIGPCPEGHEVAHLNGDRLNNTWPNLIYATRKENMAHAMEHGTTGKGIGFKVTEDIARKIKRLKGRVPAQFIAGITGLSRGTVYAIQNNKAWSHV